MNILLTISYLGKNYNGYQIQKNGSSIQEELEKALCSIVGKKVKTSASGRTDAFVSAIRQTVSFELDELPKNLDKRLNLVLPSDIRALSIKVEDENFHARFSAKRKTYLYNFYASNVNIPYLDQIALRVNESIDIEKMKKQVKFLIGTFDFSSFCASGSSVEDKVRTIYNAKILDNGLFYSLEITGNGFLYNMVRIIMGTLIEVGCGKIDSLEKVISSKSREMAGKTAPPTGLVLKDIQY